MNRNLLSQTGRGLAGLTVKVAVAADGSLLRTGGSGITFDPSASFSSGSAPQWDLGDGNTNTNNSVSHAYASTGNYAVNWNATDSLVTAFYIQDDDILSFNPSADWVNMQYLYCHTNPSLAALPTSTNWTAMKRLWTQNCALTSLDTFASWTALQYLYCNGNELTALETHSAWPLATLFIEDNNLTSLVTYPWSGVSFNKIYCFNNSLITFNVSTSWTSIDWVYCYNNNLPATEIDNILIDLDATAKTGGVLNYSSNPGSADVDRSAAAATAKSNLIAKSWTITI